MTKAELKTEINKAIEEIPESVLEEILDYINKVKESSPDKRSLSRHLGTILREDKELLQRLAL